MLNNLNDFCDIKTHSYDFFDKGIKYEKQNEWCIVVSTEKNTNPIQINFGSLADLVVNVPVNNFDETLDELLKMRSIQFRDNKSYCNVTREQLDEEIDVLGNH